MERDTEILVEWQGVGALILDGIAHSRAAGDQDAVRYGDVKGLVDSGKVKIVGTPDDIQTIGDTDG